MYGTTTIPKEKTYKRALNKLAYRFANYIEINRCSNFLKTKIEKESVDNLQKKMIKDVLQESEKELIDEYIDDVLN